MPRRVKQRKHKGVFERVPGSGIWWVRFTNHDGKRVSRCIGTFADARNFVDEQRVRVRKRIIAPVPSHRGVRYQQLVDDAIKQSDESRSDHRNFVQRLSVTVEQFGGRMADSIQPSEITEWLKQTQKKRGWTNGTSNRVRAAMSKVFKIGLENSKVTRNPVKSVTQKSESAGRVRLLNDDEEKSLRAAITHNCYMHQLDVALYTGMRKGEQFTVTLDQVDFEQKFIHLSKTKNGSSRYVSLNSKAMETFKRLKAEHEQHELPEGSTLFLNYQGRPIADPREWFTTACERAEIKGVTWHTLRHTFASRLVMKGVNLKTVQELMGHKTISMTARYAHLSPEHKLDALERLVSLPKPKQENRHERKGD